VSQNQGGYQGERIRIQAVLDDDCAMARRQGWELDRLPAGQGLELLALRRTVPFLGRRLYLSTGIHGDEPAGPLAVRTALR